MSNLSSLVTPQVVMATTTGCLDDNLQCHQWWQNWRHNDQSQFSVNEYNKGPWSEFELTKDAPCLTSNVEIWVTYHWYFHKYDLQISRNMLTIHIVMVWHWLIWTIFQEKVSHFTCTGRVIRLLKCQWNHYETYKYIELHELPRTDRYSYDKKWNHIHILWDICIHFQGLLLQTWIDFASSMDTKLNPLWSVEGNYLSIPKFQWCNCWILRMDK